MRASRAAVIGAALATNSGCVPASSAAASASMARSAAS
jgi:hypothetical protein